MLAEVVVIRKELNYDLELAIDGLIDILTNIGEFSIVTLNNIELRKAQALASDLKIANDALNTSLTNITAASLASGTPPFKPKLPKSEPFLGDRIKLRTFLGQLRVNCSFFTDVQSRLRYAFALLCGAAAD